MNPTKYSLGQSRLLRPLVHTNNNKLLTETTGRLLHHLHIRLNAVNTLVAGLLVLVIGCSPSTTPIETVVRNDCVFGQQNEIRALQSQPTPPAGKQNLHPNPTVEESLSFHGQAVRSTFHRSDDWASEGDYSVKVTIDATTLESAIPPMPPAFARFYAQRGTLASAQEAVKASPNTEYTVSTAVKSHRCGELSVGIREFDDSGDELEYTVADGEKVSERPNWLSITFTTTPRTTGFSTEVRSGPQAPLWKGFVYYYDNIQVWAPR